MPDSVNGGWDWLNSQPTGSSDRETRHCFVRSFHSDAGRQVLAHLRSITIDRRTPPETPDSVLRHLEGQRYLVQLIERLANAEIEETGNSD